MDLHTLKQIVGTIKTKAELIKDRKAQEEQTEPVEQAWAKETRKQLEELINKAP